MNIETIIGLSYTTFLLIVLTVFLSFEFFHDFWFKPTKISRNAANIMRVIGAFMLLMGVLFGGAYTLHVITLDHWAAFPVIEAMVLLICACLALLVFAGSKLTDEWGRK